MRIVNNKIYISQGETPTYSVNVIDKSTGIPMTITPQRVNPVIEFIVRPSVFSGDDDFVLRAYLPQDHVKRFSEEYKTLLDVPIVSLDEITTGDAPLSDNLNKLHRYEHDGTREFYYYDSYERKWIEYTFEISFMMEHKYTSKMEAKTYKYEIVLFDADIVYKDGEEVGLENIRFKKPLLEATDFIVGGSLSE